MPHSASRLAPFAHIQVVKKLKIAIIWFIVDSFLLTFSRQQILPNMFIPYKT